MTTVKTSLSLSPEILPLAKAHADAAGMTVSAWFDKAVRNLAANEDTAAYTAWYDGLSDEDKAIDAAWVATAWDDIP